MSLMTFVGNPVASQYNPAVGGAVPLSKNPMVEVLKGLMDPLPAQRAPQVATDPGFVADIKTANMYPKGFMSGITHQDVLVYTSENPAGAAHGDVTVFRRPSGSVGVKQFINGIWKTLYNDEEAMKKFNTPPASAPTPQAPMSNQVLGIMVIGATTDNSLVGQSAENKTIGVVKRDSGTVGVKQMLNGKWETLYTEAEAKKKFVKDATAPKIAPDQLMSCINCGDEHEVQNGSFGTDGYFVCDYCK